MATWDIFLSYTRPDAAFASRFTSALRTAGVRVFDYLQPDVLSSVRLPLRLAHAVLESKIFCLLGSDAAWGEWDPGLRPHWIWDEYRVFVHRPWGIWGDDVRPFVVIVTMNGFSKSVTEVVNVPWSIPGIPRCRELVYTMREGSEPDLINTLLQLASRWDDASHSAIALQKSDATNDDDAVIA